MKVQLIFAWYDLWIGAFYDQKKRWIYIFLIPTIGLIIKLPEKVYPEGYCEYCKTTPCKRSGVYDEDDEY